MLKIHLSLLFKSDLLPEIGSFVYADEEWERDVARLLIKIRGTVLEVEVVIAVLLEDLVEVCIVLQVLFVLLDAAELVHADLGQVLETAGQVHVLLNSLDDLVLRFRQGRLLRPA